MAGTVTLDEARRAKSKALTIFEGIAEVVGVGITLVNDNYCLKVNLKEVPAPEVRLPTHVLGVPLQIEVTGSIKKR
ncbi:MAG: hypothetical protein U0930_13475 [Pirellulales bacterium]